MAEVEVERLTIRASGISPADGRRLAERVVRRLADRPAPTVGEPPSEGEPGETRIDGLTDLDAVAARIAGEVLRRIG